MTRAYNTATTQQNSGGAVPAFLAGKNLVINGGFDIWQRGTSIAGNSSLTNYTADRWLGYTYAPSTYSRQVTNDTTNLPFIQYCMRIQRTAGSTATDWINFSYSLETINSIPSSGKTVTFSFYARKGATFNDAGNAFNIVVMSGTGTDQNSLNGFTGQTNPISATPTLTTTWQRFTYTGTVPSNSTQLGFYFAHRGSATAAGATDYYEVTGVQLELGSVATPFSRAGGDIQGELAACQRYYVQYGPNGTTNYEPIGSGWGKSTTQAQIFVSLPVQLRVYPISVTYSGSIYVTDTAAGTATTGTKVTLTDYGNKQVGLLANVASGLTQFRPYELFTWNDSTAYVGINAEL
jgi:hypothetical protein